MSGVHYVSDGCYTLGSLSCCVCGHTFPLTSSPHVAATCGNCGVTHQPGAYLDLRLAKQSHHYQQQRQSGLTSQDAQLAAARFFTKDEIAQAVAHVSAWCNENSSSHDDDDGEEEESAEGGAAKAKKGQKKTAAGGGSGGGVGVVRVGQTAVDNRVLEEAFCESCATHRMCKTFARQTRSADEGQTIFFQCTVCNAEWQQSS